MVTNIWVAVADENTEAVLHHLDSGAFTPNSKDPNGYTPLHAAASYGNIELLKLLVSRGGDINIQDAEGDTPLHYTEDMKTARFMVEELKADYRIKNEEGHTAYEHIEEEDEFPELARYLKSLLHDLAEEAQQLDHQTQSENALKALPEAGESNGHKIRYTMEDEQMPMSDEKRKQLEAIVNSENPEEALRELVTSAVRDGLANYKDPEERDVKRSREN